MYIIYVNLLATARAWCALVFTYGGRAAKTSQGITAEQWRASRLVFRNTFDIGRPCRRGTCNAAKQNAEGRQRITRQHGKHNAKTLVQKVGKQRLSHTYAYSWRRVIRSSRGSLAKLGVFCHPAKRCTEYCSNSAMLSCAQNHHRTLAYHDKITNNLRKSPK